MEKWWINQKNVDSESRVREFVTYLNTWSPRATGNPVFMMGAQEQACLSAVELRERLDSWDVPRVQSLLRVDVAKDFDYELDKDKIDFMREIKATMLCYVCGIDQRCLTLRDAYELYSYLHKFKVLFEMEQYGMQALWKAFVRLLIKFISSGKLPFLLFFMEWFPGMITKDHYIKVECDSFLLTDHSLRLASRANPTLALLFQKHQQQFEVYFQQH
jgi:hypothetical protein